MNRYDQIVTVIGMILLSLGMAITGTALLYSLYGVFVKGN